MKAIIAVLLSFVVCSTFAQKVETIINDPSREFESIHWHPDGRIISADYSNGNIYRINLNGTVETAVTGFNNLAGGGFDVNGQFYFSGISNGSLYRLNNDNTYDSIAGGLNQPVGVLTSDDPDVLYVAEYGGNSISKVTISTGNVQPWVTGGVSSIYGPDAIVYHESGDILVANFNNNKIHRVDSLGNITPFTTVPSSGYLGYLTRAVDHYYAPSFTGRKIYRIDENGNSEFLTGTGAAGYQDGYPDTATFISPNGIASNAAGDSILVTDVNRVRLITGFAPSQANINEIDIQHLTISPNPSHQTITVSYDLKGTIDLHWKILTLGGKTVKQSSSIGTTDNNGNLQVSIDDLASGSYIFRLLGKDGVSANQRFVIN